LPERASLPEDSGGWGTHPCLQPPLLPLASFFNGTERSLQAEGSCEQDASAVVIDAVPYACILHAIAFAAWTRRE